MTESKFWKLALPTVFKYKGLQKTSTRVWVWRLAILVSETETYGTIHKTHWLINNNIVIERTSCDDLNTDKHRLSKKIGFWWSRTNGRMTIEKASTNCVYLDGICITFKNSNEILSTNNILWVPYRAFAWLLTYYNQKTSNLQKAQTRVTNNINDLNTDKRKTPAKPSCSAKHVVALREFKEFRDGSWVTPNCEKMHLGSHPTVKRYWNQFWFIVCYNCCVI